MYATPDSVTGAAFAANDPILEAARLRKQQEAQAAEQARVAAEQAKAAQEAAKVAQPPAESSGPTSPVATPTSLGSKLVEAAQSGAKQGLAQESSAQPQGGDLAAYPAVLQRQGGNTGNFRNTTGGVVNAPTYGSGGDSTPEVLASPEVMAAQQKLDAERAQAGTAIDRPAGADPANDLAKPQGDLPVGQPKSMGELLKLVPELKLPGEGGKPIGNAPPVDYSKMTAREEAKARLKGEGKDKRTKWQKLGIALSVAGDTLSAGRSNFTAENLKASSPQGEEDRLTAIIQAERDRLQADNDKKREQTRQDAADARETRRLDQKDVELANDLEIARERARTAATESERKAAADQVKAMTATSMAKYREALIDKLKRNGTTIPPGGQYSERDPVSGEMVVILSNELQTVTTNDTTTTKSAVNAKGEPIGTVTERKQDTTVKGARPAGGRATGGQGIVPNREAVIEVGKGIAASIKAQGRKATAEEKAAIDAAIDAGWRP